MEKAFRTLSSWLGLPAEGPAGYVAGPVAVLLFLLFCVASLMGWLSRPWGDAQGPFLLLWPLAAYGPVLLYAFVLARGKRAPLLHARIIPLMLFCLVQLALSRSGGAESPLVAAHALLALAVACFSAPGLAAVLALAAAGLLCGPARGWVPAALASLAGLAMGLALRRGREQAAPESQPQLEPEPREAKARRGEAKESAMPPSQGLPAFDSAAFIERSFNNLLEMAFQSHPQWNSLLLLWVTPDAKGTPGMECRSALSRVKVRCDFRQEEGDGIFGWVLKEQKILQVARMPESSAAALPHYDAAQKVQTLACVPFFSEGAMWGALAFDRLDAAPVEPAETIYLEALGRQMVTLVHQARFADQARSQGEQYSRLHEASRRLSEDLDREALLRCLPGLIKTLVPSDALYLAMREEDRYRLAMSEGYAAAFASRFEGLDLRAGLSGWVLDQAEAVAFSASGLEGQVPAFITEGLGAQPQSSLLVPLALGHRVTGLLKLDRFTGAPFGERDREVASIFAAQLAVTMENARLYTQHKQMATTDGLTGLFNHRYFQERLALEIEKCGRGGEPVCLALLDIDLFKKFNDTFGHQEGDNVLKKVAKLLKQQARPGKDIPCRYGGEEFVMVYPQTSLPEAIELADKLRAESERTLSGGNEKEQRPITFSVGVSAYPMGAKDQRQLIHLADEALYLAKKDGRNRVKSFKDLGI